MRTGEQPSNNSIRAAAHARNNLVPHPYHWRVHCHARPSRRQGLAERGIIAPEIANGSRFLCLFKLALTGIEKGVAIAVKPNADAPKLNFLYEVINKLRKEA
ncbi:hypothetical protein CEXT_812191 [Caerostris extrusa]|uniref:Uncharacterized protein n=1 Tax=Caerostris extrusa TaxID=172846 RepID=A0AAV4TD25_CAEEX|nr:hypothetical protein CEXT_812191 [Caerostris extrusa]